MISLWWVCSFGEWGARIKLNFIVRLQSERGNEKYECGSASAIRIVGKLSWMCVCLCVWKSWRMNNSTICNIRQSSFSVYTFLSVYYVEAIINHSLHSSSSTRKCICNCTESADRQTIWRLVVFVIRDLQNPITFNPLHLIRTISVLQSE